MNLVLTNTKTIYYDRNGLEVEPSPLEIVLSRCFASFKNRLTEVVRIVDLVTIPVFTRDVEDIIQSEVVSRGWSGENVYADII